MDDEFGTGGTSADFDVYITNSGTITASGARSFAIDTDRVSNDRVENTGTITGNIALGGGNNVLINGVGGEIQGSIDFGGGNDRVINDGEMNIDSNRRIDLGDGDDTFIQ